MRIAEGHRWLENSMIGIVASINDDIFCGYENVTWYNRDGETWKAPNATVEVLGEDEFVKCTEEEARALLKDKK